jgi:ribosomal protein S18 acetylase RimI-like enzyme
MTEATGGPLHGPGIGSDRQDAGWRIRPATVEDSPDLLRMRRAMFLSMGYQDAGLLDRMVAACADYFAHALPSGECRAWLAENSGQPVGCGALLVQRRPPSPRNLGGREGHILNVYTEPEWRGRGIATAITETMLAQIQAEGITMASLHASPEGRPIYERLGFRDTNEMRLPLPGVGSVPGT